MLPNQPTTNRSKRGKMTQRQLERRKKCDGQLGDTGKVVDSPLTNRSKRGKVTQRQLERRRKKYDGQLGDTGKVVDSPFNKNESYQQIYSFGENSRVLKGNGRYLIDVSKNDLEGVDVTQLYSMITFAKSPVIDFMTKGGIPDYPIRPAKPYMLHFGIWMNNVQHYSGGRIHILLTAYLLASIGHKVTIITDVMPPMLKDFRFFQVEDRIEFVAGDICFKSDWLLKNNMNNIDIAIATPRILEAFAYARKWNIPCYAMLLESPNFVSEHRGGLDGTEAYWREYKQCILQYADNILSNPGPTLQAVKKWLDEAGFEGNYFDYPPPINAPACDRVSCEEQNEVTFIGRHLDFKCPDDVIKSVGKIDEGIRPSINFIGSHNRSVRARLQMCADHNDVEIKFYAGINDLEKFYIIKRSKVIVIPSRFEGFGMPPAEALYCGKPVVVYDLEITKWIYGDSINYIKPGHLKGMAKKIAELIKNDKLREEQALKGIEAMWNPYSNIPCLPHKIKNQMRATFYGKSYPKITAGIIVLNGCDTLKPVLDSIYDSVESIIVVEGVVEDYAIHNSNLIKGGHSIDGTLDFFENYPDPLEKIEVIKIEDVYPKRKNKCWKNKNEMQNAIAERIKTELYLKVDSDEVWKESDIEYVRRLFMTKKELTVVYMQRWHFWKNLHTVAVGGQWDSAEARAWRWNPEFRHPLEVKGGFNFYIDASGTKVAEPFYKAMRLMMRMHYHLGYYRKEVHIQGKINYYKNRGIEQNVKDNYTDWQPGQPTNSTHPNGTTAIPFNGSLPIALDENVYPKRVKVNPQEVDEDNVHMLKSPLKQ
jgi:glycosyltransferase involved in cell wall biosynthesis